ncbi:S8 family peptidase [Streptomyces sp. CBMA29]|uniref:S8 family peptidase n=1 Tax=Streptomyces sp. CBMA29 TaxID=1896314 RepID=UPI0016620094|nr:S8 family peptidase [Streptomyces sp. CBMA29]MBD0738633.1 peptidase S8 [Streptomyces sp. CBMA29]
MRRTRFAAVVSTGLILAVSAAVPAGVAVAAPVVGKGPAASTAATATATVRLITGDRVRVATTADGRHTASVEPGAGRERIVFHTADADGRLTVLPSDADPLVRSGRLDRRLFDVTGLVSQQYDEEHRATLPLIVGGGMAALAAPGAPTRDLGSIGAHSLTVSDTALGDFWRQVAAPAPAGTAKAAAVPKIWLDGRVKAAADSMDQIGAPPLWKAGYEGAGVKVAVLDTGVDQTHPDLKGRVAKAEDFTGSPTGTGDHFGHGTHVASIVGGTGAASGGARKGVAKAANLLVGKVLGDDGYGYDSQVIAGMQWAADQGAKVVNMSLGADDESDGTDPMSLALNEISEASGTLFVVAAGNNGQNGQQTVGIPGVADDALTVGAVDGQDALANFSSRGPRYGDGAVKPDVTAPGVDIVAARASGTTLGDPVDPYYVSLSGTSMATPHVAGAAALLAQRHPDWTARQLKDALVSTAHTVDGQAVTDQGGGRIDVSAAALGTLTATGTVFLGDIHGTDPKAAYPVTYTNTSAAPVTLTLGLALRTSGGRAVNAGAVRIGDGSAAATKVTVPAHAAARVVLTLDPAKVTYGSYYGYLTATPAGAKAAVVHTTLGLVAHGPLHTLTVTAYDAHGAPAHPTLSIWGASGLLYPSGDSKGTSTSGLEEGTYQVRASFQEMTDDGMEERLVVLPEVKLTKDTAVTVDARRTTQVEIRTPKPAEQSGIPYYQTYRQIEGRGLTESEEFFTGILSKLYVSPTAKVTDGAFEFSSRWQLAAPQLTTQAPGTGLNLKSYYTSYSPLFDSKGVNLTAVDAGSLEAPDFSGARGKLAVVRNESGEGERELAAAAAKAGVRGLMIVHFSDFGWTRWYPTGERNAVPTVRVGKAAGDALLARLAKKPVKAVTVRFGGTAVSPYLYDVFQTSTQQIPQKVVHTVTAANSAVIRTTYAENGGAPWASEQRFAWRPYQSYAWEATRNVPTGVTRTEYVSANGTYWMHRVNQETTFDIDQPLLAGMIDATTTYRAGKQPDQAWQQAVVRPSIPRGTRTPSVRNGDVLDLRIPEFTDSGAGHWARAAVGGDFGGFGTAAGTTPQGTPVEGDSATATLFRDGRQIAAADSPWADLEVPAGTADYRLDVATSRVSPEWRYATDTSTSWWFRSGTTAQATLLPLLQVDYAVPVDAFNAVRKGSSHTVGLTVRAQDGAAVPTGVKVEVQASYDDGRTWTSARVDGRGHNTFDARLTKSAHSRGDAYVTLRVTARDAAGDQVRQTVRRAYLWRG